MSKYIVKWVSIRGFANEGTYLYGTPEAIAADSATQAAHNSDNGVVSTIATYADLDKARARAIREANADRASYRRQRMDFSISAEPAEASSC